MKENIVCMVEEQAKRLDNLDAFRYKCEKTGSYKSISWNQLSELISSVSRSLISLGYGFADNVGIFSDNRPEWVVADLGILGVRGVTVPFYATSSRQQLKYIADETKMRLIFVGNKEQYEKASWLLENSETVKKIVVFDSNISCDNNKCIGWTEFIQLAGTNQFQDDLLKVKSEAKPEDLATIIYTSGTTGESKGVMLTHASYIYTFKIHDERLKVSKTDVSACFLPLSHVFERTWTFYILHCGAINVFIENPREVVNLLPRIKPTVMCAVPRFFEKTYDGVQLEISKWPGIKRAIFNWAICVGHKRSDYLSKNAKVPTLLSFKYSIADKLVLEKFRKVFGGNIRFMPCAGAAISKAHLRFFHAAGITVCYGYGTTETTATVSCFKDDVYDFDTVGSVMPGIEVKISPENEIMVKGKTLFQGYYKKPLDTEKVLKDGWYYTGDKGYLTENGDLVMTDRIKDLMKTSVGKYISPQKIELLFIQDNFIEQILPIGDGRKYVTALIVPSFDMLKKEAKCLGLENLSNEELVSHEKIIHFYQSRIEKIQEEFSPYEKVIKFKLLAEPFSIQNGGLTNTLKVRRNKLAELYSEMIDEMYA
ncbi:MAG TPA: long-chain fatty acid--CoA ligase [Bacteroidales bacterium]|nr:long-chain fatty acid--CoA ligase [Bacteroidales bacterium]